MGKKKMSSKTTQAWLDQALIDAACSGDAARAAELLAGGASAKAVDAGGFTALMWAARYDLADVAKELLPQSEAARRDPDGRDALELARAAAPGSKVAGLIESWNLAREELAELGLASHAPKRSARRFSL